jgi:hypothetical protein
MSTCVGFEMYVRRYKLQFLLSPSFYSFHSRGIKTHHQFSCRGTLLVAQLVDALRYKSEGRGFDSRWSHWISSLTKSFRPHYGSGVDSASNRNDYQDYFLKVKAAGA